MKHIGIFVMSGLLATALTVGGLTACTSEPTESIEQTEQTIWYKDIAAAYFANGIGNAFDYTELSEQIPNIEPKDRQELLALSEEQINSMTTGELLVTCLDYPLFANIFFYDNNITGLTAVAGQYNGLLALLARADAGDVLVGFYGAVSLDSVLQTDSFGTLRLEYLEAMLLSDEVLCSIDSDRRRELFNICVSNISDIYEKYLSEFSPYPAVRIAGKILYIDSPDFKELVDNNREIADFLKGARCSEETWDRVVNSIQEFMEQE